jgi:hypothetical protein
LKGEVFGKTLPIASKLFIEALRGHSINRSEVAIEHDFLSADTQNFNVWALISHVANSNGLSLSTIKRRADINYWAATGCDHNL